MGMEWWDARTARAGRSGRSGRSGVEREILKQTILHDSEHTGEFEREGKEEAEAGEN